MKELTLKIDNIKYVSPERWAVFSGIDQKYGDLNVSISCTGTLPQSVDIDSIVTVKGKFIQTKYGKQLKCQSITPQTTNQTTSEAGILKLLQELPGLGPVKANAAITKHGAKQAWKLALSDPCKLGVPKHMKQMAIDRATYIDAEFECIGYLLGIGLTNYQASRIIDKFSKQAAEVVKENPYELIEAIDGFGFMTVDTIALKSGIRPSNPNRVKACAEYVMLNSSVNDGHTWLELKQLKNIMQDFLVRSCRKNGMRGIGLPKDIEKLLMEVKNLVIKDGKIYHKQVLEAEQVIADRCKK